VSKAEPEALIPEFPRMPWRRRILAVALAIATAITIVLTLLSPPGGVKRKHPPPPPDTARCEKGQTTDCVGGTAAVIMAPAMPAASAPR
jgi:hypothetical protein